MCTGTVFMATRRTPGGFSPQRGGTPKPRVRPPRRKVWGPNPGDACGVENAPQRGATRPTWPHSNASPHARPPFQPTGESGRVLWATAFCSTPLGFRSPNRRRPRVRLPGPRGRGAGPWALECHHVVVKTPTRTVLDCRHGVVKTRTLETRGGPTPATLGGRCDKHARIRRATHRAT